MLVKEDTHVVILSSVQAGNTNLEKYEIVRLERQKRDWILGPEITYDNRHWKIMQLFLR
jgi:methylmalonyl-CoA mutase cobalamin-binding subunit